MHCRDLEGSNARKDVVVRVVVVVVRDELAVDFLLEPGLWNTVHHAEGVRHLFFDSSGYIREELGVFSFVVACIPRVTCACSTDFKHKSNLLIFRHFENRKIEPFLTEI